MGRAGSVKMCQVYSVEYRTKRRFISALAAPNITPITHGMKDPRDIAPCAAPMQRNLQTHDSVSLSQVLPQREMTFARQNNAICKKTHKTRKLQVIFRRPFGSTAQVTQNNSRCYAGTSPSATPACHATTKPQG